MHVKIGTLPTYIAVEVAEMFKSAGIKAELKPHFDVEMEEVGYIEGKLSELIERYRGTEYEKVVRDWEEYLNAAKEVLSKPMSVSDFIASYVSRFADGGDGNGEGSDWKDVLDSNISRICEERGVNIDDLSDEEKEEIISEALCRSRDAIMKSIELEFKRSKYEYVAAKILEFSGVDVEGDEIVEKLADYPDVVYKSGHR